ncbi:uncharacterized protein LOC110646118 isoform X2 [Hevea brasiliensis]|uniref:uncharacterized protein LOC110646118 isoform X2 n=1 Tax=Hevea brasiliensis TaxID=3981 RepID=UPI0025CFBF11|nr:uncharacterized protein LOC110646118 isoform X2 [Hevea brasiliensis]
MFRTLKLHPGLLSKVHGTLRLISTRYCSMETDKGTDRGSSPGGYSVFSGSSSPGKNDSSSHAERNKLGNCSAKTTPKKFNVSESRAAPDRIYRKEHSAHTSTSTDLSSNHGYLNRRRTRVDLGSQEWNVDINSSQIGMSPMANCISDQCKFSLSTQFGKKSTTAHAKRSKTHQSYFMCHVNEDFPKAKPFDVCFPKRRNASVLEASLYEMHEENRKKVGCTIQGTKQGVLRPGMVLLKHYIPHNCQVKIVKTCRELGLGPGGFYRPSYRDGAKLHLQMMCLGLNWDPETRKYEDRRRVDGCEPPGIPCEFNLLVKRAIQDAHALIRTNCNLSNAEEVIPVISPNICIVNFYTTSGRLGLHQDRDESTESLRKGLPVVSISVGDSAEFLYGDQRDVDKAQKVVLESGDVLIFGGKSRHIFHGVTSIIPNSAPKALLEETGLRSGRLNLTFRQF